MSKDNIQIFREMMADAKVRECLASMEKPEGLEAMAADLAKVAVKFGYPLSEDDLLAIFKDRKEKTDQAIERVKLLSEADLAEVAGGSNAANASCSDTYKDKENCWFDDGCDTLINWYNQYICKRSELDSIWEIVPYNP